MESAQRHRMDSHSASQEDHRHPSVNKRNVQLDSTWTSRKDVYTSMPSDIEKTPEEP